jgi:hypothetical protein
MAVSRPQPWSLISLATWIPRPGGRSPWRRRRRRADTTRPRCPPRPGGRRARPAAGRRSASRRPRHRPGPEDLGQGRPGRVGVVVVEDGGPVDHGRILGYGRIGCEGERLPAYAGAGARDGLTSRRRTTCSPEAGWPHRRRHRPMRLAPSRRQPFRGRAHHRPDRLPGPQDAPVQAARGRPVGVAKASGRGVAVTLILAAGRDGLRDGASGRGRCSRRPHTMTGERRRWSDACGSGRVPSVEGERLTGRQESVSLRRLRSGVTWENGVEHSGSRGFADTEGVTGSNPVAPTSKALTSGNAGQLAVWGRFGGSCTGWKTFAGRAPFQTA